MMHNFFAEAKNMLGVSGKTVDMEHSIWREVMRRAKNLARAYVEEVTNAEPNPDIHYEITWGHENNDNVDGFGKTPYYWKANGPDYISRILVAMTNVTSSNT